MAKRMVKCPKCGQALRADESLGDRIRCPNCKSTLTLPGKTAAPEKAPEAAPQESKAAREFACPKCKTKLSAAEGVEHFRCPRCKTVLSAPGQPDGAAPEQAAPPAPAEPPAEDAPLAAGQTLGGYQLTRLLGKGSAGCVYEAVQEALNRRVALKVLSARAAGDAAFVSAFTHEARTAAKLNHRNIVRILDIDQDQGRHFVSMEHIDGGTLAGRIGREGRLSPVDSLRVVKDLAAALDHANEHMLIHRDLKPSNILFTARREVRLADLGLTRCLDGPGGAPEHGGPAYLAPELAENPENADCRADIYSLGCVLYHALTGQPPFPGSSAADLRQHHAKSPFPSARALVPEIPHALDTLLQKMCAKDPAGRFQTHTDLAEQVELLLQATAVHSPGRAEAKTAKGRRWMPILLGAAALAAVAVGLLFLLPKLTSEPDEQATAAGEDGQGTPAEDAKTPEEPAAKDQPGEPSHPKSSTAHKTPATSTKPKPPLKPEPPPKPEPPAPPAWKAKLDAATKRADAFARDGQFGAAVVVLRPLAAADAAAELRAAAEEAMQGHRAEAGKAAQQACGTAQGQIAKGDFRGARRTLNAARKAVTGIPGQAQALADALTAVGHYEEIRRAASQAAREAKAAEAAAKRRAEARGKYVKAVEPITELLSRWEFAEASQKLAALRFDDPAVNALVAQRKAAVEALIRLRGRMIQRIKNGKKKRLTTHELGMRGIQGTLTDANEDKLFTTTKFSAKPMPQEWTRLGPGPAAKLAEVVAKPDSGPDALAMGLLARVCASGKRVKDDERKQAEQLARQHFERARKLGTGADAFLDAAATPGAAHPEADAARAFAAALRLHQAGKHADAIAALKAYQQKFTRTAHLARHKRTLQTALALRPLTTAPPTPGPKPKPEPGPKPKPKPPVKPAALALYREAASAFKAGRFGESKKQLDELKAKFPNSPLHRDARRKPNVAAMLKAIAAHGPRLVVAASGEGKHRSLRAACAAVDRPNATITIEPGGNPGGATITGDKFTGLALTGSGDRRPKLRGSKTRAAVISLPADAKKITIRNIELTNSYGGIFVGERCSVTVQNCIATQGVSSGLENGASSSLTVQNSLFALVGLNGATARACIFQCDETPLSHSALTACVLLGPDISLQSVTATDCVIHGPLTLMSGSRLTHVTVIGPVTVPYESRGVVITKCILGSLEAVHPRTLPKEKPPIAVTISDSVLYRQPQRLRQFHKDVVKSSKVKFARVTFANSALYDYRLAKDSGLRDKKTGKPSMGCRFPKEMLDLLTRSARRLLSLVKPDRRR